MRILVRNRTVTRIGEGGGGNTSVLSMKGPRALSGYNNNNDDGLLKYTRWHKNYELQCAYMIQEIKLHLFRRDWDYRLFINYLQFGYG